ncbi:MAG: hypothetical protein KBD90_03295 [Alphaproteobacteria bacterium]|jgi:hypothetical protein|nr:hypothetical protein [Alphaproteobacteria bacterium]
MRYKEKYNDPHSFRDGQGFNSLYSLDPIQEEREAQRQEFLRKQQDDDFQERRAYPKYVKGPQQKRNIPPKNLSLEEKLEKTWDWLSKTFPYLFGPQCKARPLDVHILRDIKAHYKTHQAAKAYPQDLVIKSALYRYMEKPEYLLSLQEGAFRYDINGSAVQAVTKEEQEEAWEKFQALGLLRRTDETF